jgi:2-iminobutanoate/2-iminopropanoate deaminase
MSLIRWIARFSKEEPLGGAQFTIPGPDIALTCYNGAFSTSTPQRHPQPVTIVGKSMAMKIDRIQPAGMNVRMQQGKPAYSHVVTVTGPGKTIYIAGQLARDAEGNIVGPGDMRAQLEQTFKNLDACLKAAGATWADVVKTNTFVTDYQVFSQCSDVRMRYFGVASPTSTTIQIGRLAQPEAMVEIEMIAVVE